MAVHKVVPLINSFGILWCQYISLIGNVLRLTDSSFKNRTIDKREWDNGVFLKPGGTPEYDKAGGKILFFMCIMHYLFPLQIRVDYDYQEEAVWPFRRNIRKIHQA